MADKTRAEILEALAQYQRRGYLECDYDTLTKMLADESDRGVVVILGSHIEDALLGRILKDLPQMTATELKALTKAGGPLRDAHSRIVMGRAMGILNANEVNVLHAFRAMRNACSHSRTEISFGTSELTDALSLIVPWLDADELRAKDAGSKRLLFILMAVFTLTLLESSREEAVGMLTESIESVQSQEQAPETLPETQNGKRSPGPRRTPKG
jgi:hypothetical protein